MLTRWAPGTSGEGPQGLSNPGNWGSLASDSEILNRGNFLCGWDWPMGSLSRAKRTDRLVAPGKSLRMRKEIGCMFGARPELCLLRTGERRLDNHTQGRELS